ncbi:hypothetical protein LTR02_005291 [Friedmanniomyces endolithicus]|nr:hypothetical protein LTR94_006901 [Friedmanniomyces endolithicus]KAK0782593.1 hypothetical protein LTR75_014356 [Friedmanniomyces endolithicus]KAK0799453.1 hypothetical protein LTR59_006091 [Friedmanniomyces endolithicus]KAK0809539.1 hypothetical protein LTR38_004234 [Friedmanniomyces endolithicus]KAK0836573.1 hypothetical protein LTR03_013539 [Friedmanniomyces endolithicus]
MSSSQEARQVPGQRQSISDAPPAYYASTSPPSSWDGEKKHTAHEDDFAPPTGPSKSRTSKGEGYAPPSGPPPSHAPSEPDPPPYDPWLAIPDNALLPPPPPIHCEKAQQQTQPSTTPPAPTPGATKPPSGGPNSFPRQPSNA